MTTYNHAVEAGSDSDDEDKLHIVEEEGSLADGADCDSTLPDDEPPREHCWDRGETAAQGPVSYYCRSRVRDSCKICNRRPPPFLPTVCNASEPWEKFKRANLIEYSALKCR